MGKKDNLQDALSQLWDMSHQREINITVGKNSYDWLQASLSGDTKKLLEVRERIDRELAESRLKELAWLSNDLTESEYATFIDIDTQYKRHIGWTDDANFHGDWYKYVWYLGDKEFEYEEYGKHGILLQFKKGKYELFIWYSDESGYDQGHYTIAKGISHEDIFNKINEYDSN